MMMLVRRWNDTAEARIIFHFGSAQESMPVPISEGRWIKALDSAEKQWQGPGSRVAPEIESQGAVTLICPPHSVLVFTRERSNI
jgi:maltooligosyltrehalose trehalohydrolase